MPGGFFQVLGSSPLSKKSLPMVPRCGACGLFKNCESPKMPYGGGGRKNILIVGEQPTGTDDKKGKHAKGESGQYIRSKIEEWGMDSQKDCYWTNALICHPQNKTDKKAIEYCRPNLITTIKEIKPEIIILLGQKAVESLIGYTWKPNVGDIDRWVGWQIPDQQLNAWICPIWSGPDMLEKSDPVYDLLFLKHLNKALDLHGGGRPWKKIPNYKASVKVINDSEAACREIDKFSNSSRLVAFDYETNMLKPDNKEGAIFCCSISDGERTIAYPWNKNTRKATGRFLKSPVCKVASNMDFELRWSYAEFGFWVVGMEHDTMLGAHVLDNRPEITSIKFQSYVMLGQGDYDSYVHPYLESKKKGGYEMNRIKEVNLQDLLLYCGMDSLLEVLVAHKQRANFKE